MHFKLAAAALLLACAGCATGTPAGAPAPNGVAANPSTPNGDVVSRPNGLAPDTPPGAKPNPRYKDKAVDTDPSSPRFQDRGQRVQAPLVTQ